jgi:hypothetical protein
MHRLRAKVAMIQHINHSQFAQSRNIKITAIEYKGENSNVFAYLLEESDKKFSNRLVIRSVGYLLITGCSTRNRSCSKKLPPVRKRKLSVNA